MLQLQIQQTEHIQYNYLTYKQTRRHKSLRVFCLSKQVSYVRIKMQEKLRILMLGTILDEKTKQHFDFHSVICMYGAF